jgi:iron-sulfur cluster assembly accessory protein
MNTVLTTAACEYIKKMLAKNNGAAFRLSIKKTGCSGYSYVPEIMAAINPADTVFETNDIKIYFDTSWLHLLKDLHIDYVEEEKSGLKQKRLLFSNPKEVGRCGCGESFHVEGKS